MDFIYELDDTESSGWGDQIRRYRSEIIKAPDDYVQRFISQHDANLDAIKGDITGFIVEMRESMWSEYIKDEAEFHTKVITDLIDNREAPNELLKKIIREGYLGCIQESSGEDEVVDNIAQLVGGYTGRIMPYLYALGLSTTQSRRSRAGFTFERVIAYIMKVYGYPYEDQQSVGSNYFEENRISKKMDGLVPSVEEYKRNKNRCMVITMKTLLRERWQEVADEINRVNMPQIYLLTLDETTSLDTLQIMDEHRIILVGKDGLSEKYRDAGNFLTFSDFFNRQIPHCLTQFEGEE